MNLAKCIIEKSRLVGAKIVFPEAEYSARVQSAIKQILKMKMCEVIVLCDKSKLPKYLQNNPFVKTVEKGVSQILARELYLARAHKGLTELQAKKLIKNEIYFATMLVRAGLVDGMVCGAENSSADTVRPALQLLRNNDELVSSCMILVHNKKPPIIMTDCALVVHPDAEQLARIARNTADFSRAVLDIEPRVAFLSYSSKGSGNGESVDVVKKAVSLMTSADFQYFGEVQVDVALSPSVARAKKIDGLSESPANILVFPSLDSGNIGYKIAQQLGGYDAIGPIMSNLTSPVNDLSRGCTVQDIILTTAVTILQTKRRK